ncbi:hypothetical protein Tco_1148347 [Tanacetum coccineum]
MLPALSGDVEVKNGVFTPEGVKKRRIYRVSEKREKSPNDKCEGIVISNINLISPREDEETAGNKQIAVQREIKARTILLQSLPEDHMADFHHLDDAKDIWLAVKARFGGNEESKKMRKSMLKQEFVDFKISKSEGLHKGYDRFQKVLSQLNQMQARPDNSNRSF